MNFWGVAYAAVLIVYGNVVGVTWTNPCDDDLHSIQFYAVFDERPADTLTLSRYYGKSPDELTPPHLEPCAQDTAWLAFPCRSESLHCQIHCTAFDTTEVNESGKSNIRFWTQTP